MTHILISVICIKITLSVAKIVDRPINLDFLNTIPANLNVQCDSEEEVNSQCQRSPFSCLGSCGEVPYSFEITHGGIINHEITVCSCDRFCLSFGDCCWDFEIECASMTDVSTHPLHYDMDCIDDRYSVIASCPESWVGPIAENLDNHPKYVSGNPVKHKYTGLHFRNISYLVCNGYDVDNAEYWATTISTSQVFSLSDIKAIFTGNITLREAHVTAKPKDIETIRGCKFYKGSQMINFVCTSCENDKIFQMSYHNISYICQTYDATTRFRAPLCEIDVQNIEKYQEGVKSLSAFYSSVGHEQRLLIIQDLDLSTRWRISECDLVNNFECVLLEKCSADYFVLGNTCYSLYLLQTEITLHEIDMPLLTETNVAKQLPMNKFELFNQTYSSPKRSPSVIKYDFHVAARISLNIASNSSMEEYIVEGFKAILNGSNNEEVKIVLTMHLHEINFLVYATDIHLTDFLIRNHPLTGNFYNIMIKSFTIGKGLQAFPAQENEASSIFLDQNVIIVSITNFFIIALNML